MGVRNIGRLLTALLLSSDMAVPARAVAVKPLRKAAALGVLRRLGSILQHNDGGSLAESLSIDIGGTLVKIVLYRRRDAPMQSDDGPPRLDLEDVEITQSLGALRELSVHVPGLGGDLHFFVFETKQIEDVVGFFARFWPQVTSDPKLPPQITLRATGGGAYKHAEIFRQAGIKLKVGEEMDCIVLGLNFLMACVPGEVFSVALRDTSPLASPRGETETALCCPVAQPPVNFLYVSIGSGVSIVEVRGRSSAVDIMSGGVPTRYRRVGGSSLGGSSFWGLVRLLTSCSTFDEVIRLTERGASSNVDMLVSDIYGDGSHELGLGGDVIAASFGKIAMRREDDGGRGPMFLWRYLSALLRHYEEGFWLVVLAIVSLPCFQFVFDRLGIVSFAEARAASTAMCGSYRAHDVALSLLRMVSNNIGHIATLSAQQCGLRHIVFGGSFIRDHPYTISTISSAVRFFSRGIVQVRALPLATSVAPAATASRTSWSYLEPHPPPGALPQTRWVRRRHRHAHAWQYAGRRSGTDGTAATALRPRRAQTAKARVTCTPTRALHCQKGSCPCLTNVLSRLCCAALTPRGHMLCCHPPIVGTDLQRDAAKRGGRTEAGRADATLHGATDPAARPADCAAWAANVPTVSVAVHAATCNGRPAAIRAATANRRELAVEGATPYRRLWLQASPLAHPGAARSARQKRDAD